MYKKEIALALAGFVLWTTGDAAVRLLGDFPTILVGFISGILAVFFLACASPWLGGLKRTLTMPQLGLRVLRGVILSCSALCAFLTFKELDMATAYTFIFAAPFLSKILSVVINKEQISWKSWAITALGFTGVLVALRPGMIEINIGIMAALGCAGFFSTGYVLTRFIKKENQTLLSMALFQYVSLSIVTAYPALMILTGHNADVPVPEFTPKMGVLALMIVVPNLIGNVIVARAFSGAPAAVISPLHYVQILCGIAFGAFLFNEYPDSWTLAGAAIIVIAGVLLALRSKQQPSQLAQKNVIAAE